MDMIKLVANVAHKFVDRSLTFLILICDIEISNRITIKRCILPVDQNVMIINPDSSIIVRKEEDENLLIKLLLTR